MAHNLGVEKAETELFTCVDSDDTNRSGYKIIVTWKDADDYWIVAAKWYYTMKISKQGLKTGYTIKGTEDNFNI